MPPAKKRRVALPTLDKMGKIRQYLTDQFCLFPEELKNLKSGHILLQYFENDNSSTKTIKSVMDRLPCSIKHSQLLSLLNKANKFKNIGRECDREKYETLCHQPYTLFDPVHQGPMSDAPHPEPGPSENLATEQRESQTSYNPEQLVPGPLAAPYSPIRSSARNQGLLTPRKLKLKKRLAHVSLTKHVMEKNYKRKVGKLRSEINFERLHKIKYLNQEITRHKLSLKRKDNKIKELRLKFSETELAKELAKTKQQLKNVTRNHKRLKNANKTLSFCACASKVNAELLKAKEELKLKNAAIVELQNDKLCLEDIIKSLKFAESSLEKRGKTYSLEMRMFVYDAIINNVPTRNVPPLIQTFNKRVGVNLGQVPHRNTVEMMTRELGVISDFQASELFMESHDLTLGFDATMQEGVHINSVHITSPTACHVLAIDQLAGGTAEDYALHINEAIDCVNDVYCQFYTADFAENRKQILASISNTMTDRAAVNHATIERLQLSWRKTLNELNCHLHPLETIATSTRSVLKAMEPANIDKRLWGTECLAHQLVLAVNKFRYKDGRGDPKGFKSYLDNAGLPRGLIPRYRGNRLHIMFHICGQFYLHQEFFYKLFKEGTVSCGGLQGALSHDFMNPCAQVEIQILGLIGKLLSGPWMAKLYTPASSTISHVKGIAIVKDVVNVLKTFKQMPKNTLSTKTDFFGDELCATATLSKLQEKPVDETLFMLMMKASLSKIVDVIEKQYQRYFATDISDQLRKETESARCHNVDAEEIIGMFSAAQEHAPNATMWYLSSRIRAKKNNVVKYLDNLEPEKRHRLIKLAVQLVRKHRPGNRKKIVEIRAEITRRIARKCQKKKTLERNKLKRLLRSCETRKVDIAEQVEFGNVEESVLHVVKDILAGKIVGHQICHIWFDEQTQGTTVYNGKVEKLLKRNGGTYRIGYWQENQTYDNDAEDYDISKYALAIDLICEDLILS